MSDHTGRPIHRLGAGWFSRLSTARASHVSLGTFCHGAAALRDAGLRTWSGPFDWIFSTPRLTAECLRDDFARLLDPAELRSVPIAELTNGSRRQCHHPAYEARFGVPIVFNHHDPLASAADAAALRRGADRVRRALAPDRSDVFYLFSEVRWSEDDLSELAAALRGRSPRATLAVVTATAGEGPRTAAIDGDGRGMHGLRVDVGTRSRSLGARFADPADDLHLGEILRDVASRLASMP